jgi:hypothetical protein
MKDLPVLKSLQDPTQMAYPKKECKVQHGFLIHGRRFINVRR